ncbi:MAG: hypothetical protein ACPGFA_06645 [Pikeienuella sp.]
MKRSLIIVAALVAAPLFATSANAAPQANDSWRNFTVLGVLGVTLGAYHTNEEGKQVVNPRAHRQVYRNTPSAGRFDQARRNHAIVPPYYGARRYDPRRQFGPLHRLK